VLAYQVAVQQGYRTPARFEEPVGLQTPSRNRRLKISRWPFCIGRPG
jgi:hypothetical protein